MPVALFSVPPQHRFRLIHCLIAVLLTSVAAVASAQAKPGRPSADPAAGPASCGPAAGGGTCAGAAGVASQGSGGGADVGAGNPVNVITGNKYQREVDLAPLPGRLGLEIIRHYNSAYSNPNTATGILGRGWKLSYETDLYPIGNTIQVMQADGSRIIFNRDPAHPQLCSTLNPADGQLRIDRTPAGETYVWTWTNGRALSFDAAGKLVQIAASTGEFVSLQRDAKGMLVQVTDPQGRRLQLQYASAQSAGNGFRGVVAIISPVGRFDYAYGSTPPVGSTQQPASLAPNLVRVGYPAAGAGRQYHYEDPRHPTYLSGITVLGPGALLTGGAGEPLLQRISTYLYDAQGRAVLSVRGLPARLQTSPTGTPLQHARLVDGTGISQVTLDYSAPGMTILANSLGQKTTYRHGIVGGQFRLLDVRGAGCASCGEMNLRYGYDALGRQTSMTRLTVDGQPIRHVQTVFDQYSRPVKVSTIDYVNGKATAPRLQARYDYAPGAAPTPILITRPSVVPGQEHRISIAYAATSDAGLQPVEVSETGHVPTMDGTGSALAINRTMHYRYGARGQRIERDGPLQNATYKPGPDNSDISRTEYDPTTGLMTRAIAPGGLVTEIRGRDAALRPVLLRTSDGVIARTIRLSNNWRGQPEEISIEAGLVVQAAAVKTKEQGQAPDRFATESATRIVRTTRYRYDGFGNLASIAQAGNRITQFRYDGAGRLMQRILPDGTSSMMQHDTEGHLDRQSEYADQNLAPEALLASTAFHYDDTGRLTGSDDALGPRSRLRYDRAGEIAEVDNALGTTTRFSSDIDGLLQARTDAAGTTDAATVSFGHDAHGQTTRSTDANGVTTETRHDDFGRKVAEISPDRGVTLYRHDAAGRIIARIDESRTTTRYTYDNANRLIALGADKQLDLVQYRYVGQQLEEVVTTTDGKPEHATERTRYAFDALGRVTQERQWIGKLEGETPATPTFPLTGYTFVTHYFYDAADHLVRQVLPDGHALSWRYAVPGSAGAGKSLSGTDQPEAILFDHEIIAIDIRHAGGGLTGYTTGNGILQQIARDSRGRIIAMQAVTAPAKIAAKVAANSRHPGTVIYSQVNRFDVADRLTGIDRKRLSFGAGRVVLTSSDTYGYDRLDRLISIREGNRDATKIAYDRGGNRTSEAPLQSATPTYLPTSGTPATSKMGVRSYRYAAGTNRLIGVADTAAIVRPVAAGVPAILQADTTPATAADAASLIQSTWLYHATGVPLARLDFAIRKTGAATVSGSQRIAYNSARRPVAVFDGEDHLIAKYRYNSQGERIAKTVYAGGDQPIARTQPVSTTTASVERGASKTVYSLYSNQRLIAETDDIGRITAHYIYLAGRPIAKVAMQARTGAVQSAWKVLREVSGWRGEGEGDALDATATIYAVHADHRGAPQAVTDERQNVVWQADTDAFGSAVVSPATALTETGRPFEMNLRLPGQIYDAETGQHYNYQRSYEPRLGRYTTPDPIGLEGGSNPYSYVSNNPLTKVDPLGLYEEDVHYYMTYFLALTAGLPPKQAWTIATADRYIDDNSFTEPFGYKGTNFAARADYHFTQFGHDSAPSVYEYAASVDSQGTETINFSPRYIGRRYVSPDNPQLRSLYAYAMNAPTPCARAQFYGEFLHAFEDTFAHREADNQPYGDFFGHLSGGHNPDHTYNAVGWDYNEARTLEMEKEVFALFKKSFSKTATDVFTDKAITISALTQTLEKFNKDLTPESPDLHKSTKIKILNDKLFELGLPTMQRYQTDIAMKCRNDNLRDASGNTLNPRSYPNAILKTDNPDSAKNVQCR